jgi:hypothetical protein
MTAHGALEVVRDILALKLASATAQVSTRPGDFSNGYRAGVLDCLALVNELVQASKRPQGSGSSATRPG